MTKSHCTEEGEHLRERCLVGYGVWTGVHVESHILQTNEYQIDMAPNRQSSAYVHVYI